MSKFELALAKMREADRQLVRIIRNLRSIYAAHPEAYDIQYSVIDLECLRESLADDMADDVISAHLSTHIRTKNARQPRQHKVTDKTEFLAELDAVLRDKVKPLPCRWKMVLAGRMGFEKWAVLKRVMTQQLGIEDPEKYITDLIEAA